MVLKLKKTIFVHPAYGTEGKLMSRDLVAITCYEYDQSQKFGIKELPLIVQY